MSESSRPDAHERIMSALRARFSEEQVRGMFAASVAVEDEVYARAREDDDPLPEIEAGWARLREERGITEDEREAIENEGLRRGW